MSLYPIEDVDSSNQRKLYTKAGVLLFLPNAKVEGFTNNLNNLVDYKIKILLNEIKQSKKKYGIKLKDNPHNEMAAIFSGKITESLREWKDKNAQGIARCVSIIDEEFINKNDRDRVAAEELDKNGNLKTLIDNLRPIYNPNELNNWSNIFGIEPIRAYQYYNPKCQYKKPLYGFFVGNINQGETSIIQAARREVLEEGSIDLDERFFDPIFQTNMRSKNNISLPLVLEYPFTKHGVTYWTRTFLLFIDEFNAESNKKTGYQAAAIISPK